METLTDFYKLYGRVNGILRKGQTYQVQIHDSYNADLIGNKKYFMLTELNSFGGINYFLPIYLGAAASMVFLILIFFFVCYFNKLHKKNRDTEDFIKSL